MYALERASADEAARIEEHLLICEACQQSLVDVESYVGLLRRGLVATEGLLEMHSTPGGVVVVRAYREGMSWVARISGGELDVGLPATTRAAAVRAARARFRELFPQHECKASCRVL
jgi:hypothetical protein